MGSIKDRNCRDLTEAEDIKKRWQEYKEELYKNDLHNPDNHDGVITHLEPDILECKVKWGLGRVTTNKATGGDGIPVELFQILKDDAVKVLHSIHQQIWKTDPFQSYGQCWVFHICWHIECSTFTVSSFRIWKSSAGIPSPPLALFVVMISKAHLTSHSRMSGSRWMSTP